MGTSTQDMLFSGLLQVAVFVMVIINSSWLFEVVVVVVFMVVVLIDSLP